jgi:MFS family permease
MTVSQAYLSDITEPKYRTRVFGYSSGVFGAGLIFGPVIGGVLSQINYSVPMFFAAAITLVSIVLVILFLPETVTKKTDKISLRFVDIIPINEVKNFAKSSKIRNLLLLFSAYSLGFFLFISNFPLLAETQLHVTADQVSFYMAWIGVIRVGIQAILIAYLLRVLGENRLLVTGVISMIVSMVAVAFSVDYLIVFVPITFLAFGTGVIRPILQSKLTNSVTQKETATILGINNSLTSVAQIIAPILGGFMIEYLPSQILTITSAVIFVLALIIIRRGRNLT